jgi:hypothetical protein
MIMAKARAAKAAAISQKRTTTCGSRHNENVKVDSAEKPLLFL